MIVAVAHDEFREMQLDNIKKMMNDYHLLIDIRGMFDENMTKTALITGISRQDGAHLAKFLLDYGYEINNSF